MKDIIKCNNKNEAEFIVKYFFDKGGFKCYDNDVDDIINNFVVYPIIIFRGTKNIHVINYKLNKNIKITEAKHLMRLEKLNRIQ